MNIIKLFKKDNGKPKERVLYAITRGTYMGTCLIFVKPEEHPQDGIYAAMAIGGTDKEALDGGMNPMQIPEEAIKDGLNYGLLDKIRKVPKELYNLCCSEYDERLKRQNESKEDESTD